MVICIIILAVLLVIAIGVAFHFRNQRVEEVRINIERQQENQRIEDSIQAHKDQLLEVKKEIGEQAQIVQQMKETADVLKEDASKQADKLYEDKLTTLNSRYKSIFDELDRTYKEKLQDCQEKIKTEEGKLNALKSKQLAYIQAQQRQKEIEEKQDYYRLNISEDDKADITLLRDIQKRLIKKDAIDKVIYETYYRPAYDALMPRLSEKNGKICGIYKITDLTTGQTYIGQSVDIRERVRQHLKASLAYGTPTNKLYQAMQNSGQSNFTFEILEEVPRDQLNEREVYWIDFYRSREFGLNKTRGGS